MALPPIHLDGKSKQSTEEITSSHILCHTRAETTLAEEKERRRRRTGVKGLGGWVLLFCNTTEDRLILNRNRPVFSSQGQRGQQSEWIAETGRVLDKRLLSPAVLGLDEGRYSALQSQPINTVSSSGKKKRYGVSRTLSLAVFSSQAEPHSC